jgi:hypothetical protein
MGRKLERMLEAEGDEGLDALYAYYASFAGANQGDDE